MYKLWVEIIGSWLLGCCFRVPFHMLCAKIGSVFGCAFCGGGKSIAIVIYRVAVVRRSHIIARALSTNMPRRQQSPRTLTHTHTLAHATHTTHIAFRKHTWRLAGWGVCVSVCLFRVNFDCAILCQSLWWLTLVLPPGVPKTLHIGLCVCVCGWGAMLYAVIHPL